MFIPFLNELSEKAGEGPKWKSFSKIIRILPAFAFGFHYMLTKSEFFSILDHENKKEVKTYAVKHYFRSIF